MRDLKIHLEKLLRDAAECKLISDLSTDRDKRGLFERLAEHYEMLAAEIRRAISERVGIDPSSKNRASRPTSSVRPGQRRVRLRNSAVFILVVEDVPVTQDTVHEALSEGGLGADMAASGRDSHHASPS
jgi:hypothetical protein